ncbi:MAG: hypothetical protein PF439_10400 [Helicobacteraceae bacterium]|jgi:hypothetical protein|nr:hypothetical protein [Helicobacteraceae bacterium]
MGFLSKLFGRKSAVVQNSFVKIPIFHETLAFPLPDSWSLEPAFRSLENGTFVLEFVGADQTKEKWHDKLIVQGFNNANDDVELNARKLLKMMQGEMAALDGDAFYSEELFSETVITREKIAVVMGLKRVPDDTAESQFGLYLIIEGEHDIYIVQRSWKGRAHQDGFLVPRDELAAWLVEFKKITLCKNETEFA